VRGARFVLLWLGVATSVVGCSCDQLDPMQQQPRDDAFAVSRFFPDGRTMQWPPPNAVPRGRPSLAPVIRTGREDGAFTATIPMPVTRDLLTTGRDRFDVYCAPCHGLLGNGNSVVAQNMTLRRPPSLIVHAPHAPGEPPPSGPTMPDGRHPHLLPGYVFAVVTEGYGLMPSYAEMLSVEERWAVVAYLEALRLSQRAPVASLPPELRQKLQEVAP